MFLASCAPPRPNLGRPLTASEECNYAAESKRRECQVCWVLLPFQIWPAFLCRGICGHDADRIASECRTFAFVAEQSARAPSTQPSQSSPPIYPTAVPSLPGAESGGCAFDIRIITNGPSPGAATSTWRCTQADGRSFDFEIFDNYRGFSTAIGEFDFAALACQPGLIRDTAGRQATITDLHGSRAEGTLTYFQSGTGEIRCNLVNR